MEQKWGVGRFRDVTKSFLGEILREVKVSSHVRRVTVTLKSDDFDGGMMRIFGKSKMSFF